VETDSERSAPEPADVEGGSVEGVDVLANAAAPGMAAGAEQAESSAAMAPADTMPASARGRHLVGWVDVRTVPPRSLGSAAGAS
jgi:hypothetical protein